MVPSVSSYSSPKKLLLHASILRHLQLFIGFCILPSNIPYTYCVVCIGMLWDAFAVPASIGPLRRISGKAHEYSDQEAKSKHIQQRKALGRKSNICDITIRKICTKLGTSDE
ncbi:Zinc finger, C2H2 type family protein [Brugia malayi]|uniref:Zinc finger, C2H2 type family protein n=1 Tax=Brugia malayi TaxID=6279 RepID=A0A4E9FT88_BRUMA|nr:Zinc finger, C2H2 type family protein [Brugia malayi]VIP00209.1 Zinc finger, C2H2 type family protein [Brugia malayi]